MSTEHPPVPEGEDLAARLAALLDEARDRGVDVSALVGAAPGITLREQLELRLPTLRRDHKGTYGTWALYLQRLADGMPDTCPCTCLACASGPCPCATGGHAAACVPDADIDCSSRMRAHGGDDVRRVTRHNLTDAAWWARRHAMQRTTVRNAKREADGRVQHDHDGRGAQEAMVQACRWLWEEMRRDGVVEANVARDVRMPTRQERVARSLDVPDFVTLHSLATTTGDDPALDGLILRHMVIQATRRGGVLSLRCRGVNRDDCTITYWDEKRDTYRTRPSTPEHLDALVAHALERGPRMPAPPDAPEELRRTGIPALSPNDPVFYYRPEDTFDADGYFVRRQARPLTRKRFETLFGRIRRHHPGFDARGLRPHDIRHTSGRLFYEAGGEAAAKLQLAHDGGSTSEHYYKEGMERLAQLKRELFSPPAASNVDDATE
ncbi:tyrosine-type recombinase/integrase [Geodermatophilus sp. URMC 62]|uniref:tyrosine-type recombinase/integrase n=1 Tax=Geodermatophilus sp. URMC 62 TaxID=3423414 RepID=UPI00406C2878